MAQENEVVIIDSQKEPKEPNENKLNTSEEEEFVAIEEVNTTSTQSSDESSEQEEEEKKQKLAKKKKLILLGAISLVFVIILFIALFFTLRGKEEEQLDEIQTQIPQEQPKADMPKGYDMDRGRIEEMISKANSLYESGNKLEALKIYENVAIYNESLSFYNLGVSQMNQEKFKDALESFKTAIKNGEHVDVSALNAAVCALHLNDKETFQYYLNLSRAFLTPNSSAYSYYSALVNYYRGYYIEAFHILNSIEEGFYANNAFYLKSKILSLIRRDKDAVAVLSEIKGYDTNLPLGLLSARLGRYDEAISYLNKVDPLNVNIDIAHLAKALIQLKLGSYALAASALENIYEHNTTFINSMYPIKAGLKDDYFNIEAAQKNFDEKVFFHKSSIFAILFYYTPFKAFDSKQIMDYITKGGVGIFIDQNDEADEYLRVSGTASRINSSLSRAVAKAINNELREANKSFLKLSGEYPGHSILQFNLALSYAQLGDYANAYKHFVTSYHLNPKSHLTGVYAIICAQMIGKDYRGLHAEVMENLATDPKQKEGNFFETLLLFSRDNSGALTRWLDEDDSTETLRMVFTLIAAITNGRDDIARDRSDKLLKLLPNDIMTNILHFLANNDRNHIKEYAKNIQIRFFHSNFDLNTLYSGSSVVREQFVKLLQISGLTEIWRNVVLEDLKASGNKMEILHTLGYIDLFTKRHDEAYSIFNDLVHNKKEQDALTLFLAAVASIGSNHPQNAVAYLELAKLTNPTDPGNRIALGLLYHELGNIPAAISQYKGVGNTNFTSRFFTFHLVN